MTYAIAHSAIRRRFKEQWSFDVPVQYPNVRFDPPETSPWLRLTIIQADAIWASFGDPGNNIERNLGQVIVQIFTPSGTGEGKALQYADHVKAIFRDWREIASGLRFRTPPYARQIGIDGKWYQVNVVAPFEFDDFT